MNAAAAKSNRAALVVAALTIAAAAVIRLRTLGDIVAHGDEQFYLLVGDRILNHGAVPYVDIWDRKPVGLFLLFAAIRALGGVGIVQYQLVATAFAAATAAIMGVWVLRVAGIVAALCTGLLYLAILQTHLGFGGQAEVFLNLFIVAASWLVYRLWRDQAGGVTIAPNRVVGIGAAAMALIGIALEIKPTAVFPGLWLGLVLLWIGWRARFGPGRLADVALLWIGTALLPTAAALLYYAGIGHLGDYLYANVWSILEKGCDGADDERNRSIGTMLRLGVPFGSAVALLAYDAWRRRPTPPWLVLLIFLIGWLVAGVVAFFAVKAAYPHYALVAAPAGCLLAGYAIGLRRPLGWLMAGIALVMSGRLLLTDQARIAQNRLIAPRFQALADAIRPELHGGCLYVYHGPHILYLLTDSCLPTRFAFPNHLSTQPEASGLGVDPSAEVARILGTKPPVIVDGENSFHPANLATQRLVRAAIAADYVELAEARVGSGAPIATAYRLRRPGDSTTR